jgi:hypothetical protein
MDFDLNLLDKVDPASVLRLRDDLDSIPSTYCTYPISNGFFLTVRSPAIFMRTEMGASINISLNQPPGRAAVATWRNYCGFEPGEGIFISSSEYLFIVTVA